MSALRAKIWIVDFSISRGWPKKISTRQKWLLTYCNTTRKSKLNDEIC